jgi:TRAP-type C4-dicarboxylate transport system permease small subunit
MQGQDQGPVSAGPAFDVAARLTRIATGAVLAALVTLVCGEAFLRGAFNYSLGFAEELTGYGVVMLTFFGASLALRQGSLFQVHFLFDAVPAHVRLWLMRVFVVVALAICIILAWKTKDVMLSSFVRGKFAPTVLRTPLWIPQMLLPLGFGVIGFFLIEKVLLTFGRTEEET